MSNEPTSPSAPSRISIKDTVTLGFRTEEARDKAHGILSKELSSHYIHQAAEPKLSFDLKPGVAANTYMAAFTALGTSNGALNAVRPLMERTVAQLAAREHAPLIQQIAEKTGGEFLNAGQRQRTAGNFLTA
jgi:hypothetical protein